MSAQREEAQCCCLRLWPGETITNLDGKRSFVLAVSLAQSVGPIKIKELRLFCFILLLGNFVNVLAWAALEHLLCARSKIIKEKIWFLPAFPGGREADHELKQWSPGASGPSSSARGWDSCWLWCPGHKSLFVFPHGWLHARAALLRLHQQRLIKPASVCLCRALHPPFAFLLPCEPIFSP